MNWVPWVKAHPYSYLSLREHCKKLKVRASQKTGCGPFRLLPSSRPTGLCLNYSKEFMLRTLMKSHKTDLVKPETKVPNCCLLKNRTKRISIHQQFVNRIWEVKLSSQSTWDGVSRDLSIKSQPQNFKNLALLILALTSCPFKCRHILPLRGPEVMLLLASYSN